MVDLKRRAKAAAALAGKDWKDLAAELETSQPTLDRNLAKSTTRKQRREAEGLAREIAKVCGVPFEFFSTNFAALERPSDTMLGRLDAIETQLAELVRQGRQERGTTPPAEGPTGDLAPDPDLPGDDPLQPGTPEPTEEDEDEDQTQEGEP